MEEHLYEWKYTLESKAMKVSHIFVSERETGQKMKMQGVEMVKVDEFNYLGSTI